MASRSCSLHVSRTLIDCQAPGREQEQEQEEQDEEQEEQEQEEQEEQEVVGGYPVQFVAQNI